jgi:hypothetical protein
MPKANAPIEEFRDIHKGKAGWVLGNSSSLRLIDNEDMRDKITYVCNEALFKVYQPTYGVTGDQQCYNYMWNYQFQTQGQYPQHIFFHNPETRSVSTIFVDRIADEHGYFSKDLNERIVEIGSPVYLAAQLATWMGCNPIFMLGNDLRNRDPISGQTHFWGSKKDYFEPKGMDMGNQFDMVYTIWKNVYPRLVKNGFLFFSCSPWSQTNDFMPYMAVEEALKHP